ncbi:MAG: 50S ribosomal protein L21 [Halanaerobiales bacterium]
MYAVIKTGGKQYKVEEGQIVKVEKLPVEEDEDIEFDRVLAYSGEDEVEFGRPYLEDVSVRGRVIEQGRNKKIIVFKYKPKKRQRKKMGHRQPYTKVLIENIERV